jgi:hypothetical protein
MAEHNLADVTGPYVIKPGVSLAQTKGDTVCERFLIVFVRVSSTALQRTI